MTAYNVFQTTPQLTADNDNGAVNLGTEFFVTATGWATQVRYLHAISGASLDARTAAIYTVNAGGTSGTLVAGPFVMPAPTPGAWCTYTLPTPLQLTANTRYRVVIHHPFFGKYVATPSYFTSAPYNTGNFVQGILTVPNSANALGAKQGSYGYTDTISFPPNEYNNAGYYSDVTVVDVDPTPPIIIQQDDITVTASLAPQRSLGTLSLHNKSGSVSDRRWGGTS